MNKRDGWCSPAGCPPLGQLPCRRWKVLERGRSTDAQGEMTRVASELMPVMLLLLWALQPAVRACAHGKGRLETTTSRSLRPCTWWTWPGCSQLHSLTDALKCCLLFKRPRGIRLEFGLAASCQTVCHGGRRLGAAHTCAMRLQSSNQCECYDCHHKFATRNCIQNAHVTAPNTLPTHDDDESRQLSWPPRIGNPEFITQKGLKKQLKKKAPPVGPLAQKIFWAPTGFIST